MSTTEIRIFQTQVEQKENNKGEHLFYYIINVLNNQKMFVLENACKVGKQG